MLLREFLGIRRPDETERSAAWIRSQQREDGTWANFHGGPGELSTTIEAYWALRLAGDASEAEHMRRAAAFVRAQGGIERARVFTHVWLALFGLWSWDEVPALPPEIVLLPRWAPLNVYDFACWARQTIVALSLVKAHRPVRPLGFELGELLADRRSRGSAIGGEPPAPRRAVSGKAGCWPGWTGSCAHTSAGRSTAAPARARAGGALDRAPPGGRRLLGRDPAPVGLLADGIAPRRLPARSSGDEAWTRRPRSVHGRGRGRRARRRGAPRLAAAAWKRASRRCGTPRWRSWRSPTRAFPETIRRWCAPPSGCSARRSPRPATGRSPGTGLAPGGWAFEFANVNYPDVDDTAEVVLALRRVAATPRNGTPRRASAARAQRRLPWRRELRPQIDGGDRPGAALGAGDAELRRRLGRVRRRQHPLAGARAAVPGLRRGDRRAERRRDRPRRRDARRAGHARHARRSSRPALADRRAGARRVVVRALGRQPRLRDRRRRSRADRRGRRARARAASAARWTGSSATRTRTAAGARTPAPTTTPPGSGAVTAPPRRPPGRCSRCTPPGAPTPPALRRGVDWLVGTQRADGTWDEPQYTGTGFPSDYYINYHLYRLVFPITALGRCLGSAAASRWRGA